MNRNIAPRRHFSPDYPTYSSDPRMEALKEIGKEILQRLIFCAMATFLMAVIALLS